VRAERLAIAAERGGKIIMKSPHHHHFEMKMGSLGETLEGRRGAEMRRIILLKWSREKEKVFFSSHGRKAEAACLPAGRSYGPGKERSGKRKEKRVVFLTKGPNDSAGWMPVSQFSPYFFGILRFPKSFLSLWQSHTHTRLILRGPKLIFH
jgi:hypothetical protein